MAIQADALTTLLVMIKADIAETHVQRRCAGKDREEEVKDDGSPEFQEHLERVAAIMAEYRAKVAAETESAPLDPQAERRRRRA